MPAALLFPLALTSPPTIVVTDSTIEVPFVVA
jgi:hypothetical protein